MITDDRLRHLSSPDYAKSEPGQIAAELLVARMLLTRVDSGSNYRLYQNPDDAPRILRDIHTFLHPDEN